ncbi:MAG: UDP-N-acetylmuramoyl-L-alanyl-D-glutamate--2,6-diaminopimelate ligase [Deltaproteobacteria bacterium]|nr:UDP-N-acetylmuramoyl-L-alanyl-D-glutamate--2,6-diaminopimelate ligase [Deltaproteobacteria bacterium]
MKLGQLLNGIPTYHLSGDPEQEIQGLAYDSRQVKPGYLFVALKGHRQNGHDYLQNAVQNGAVALVMEELQEVKDEVATVRVPGSREALSKMASQFYGHPFKGINMIGITCTNGKTTTSYLLESILSSAGARPGVIGTINYRFMGKTHPAPVTTPESLDLMRLLREMVDRSATDVILEVSSHALDQRRTGDCPFRVAIFTNFSRDHLDYHKTLEEYFQAKSLLFRRLKKSELAGGTSAIINTDDPKGEELIRFTEADVVTYGLGRKSHVRAESISADKTGIRARLMTPVGEKDIQSSLIGKINIYNILAASAAAISLNVDLNTVAEGIERLGVVPGRLELVPNGRGLMLVVDYAHTPDALLKTLETLSSLAKGRLITVFGCGGDRDKGKRYEMGLIAGENSDVVFVTSDNPRSEDPDSIIAQIEEGIRKSGLKSKLWASGSESMGKGYFIEVDRQKAITNAISMAKEKDLVLIAGKGHEDYQIIGGEIRYFDDRKEAASAAS